MIPQIEDRASSFPGPFPYPAPLGTRMKIEQKPSHPTLHRVFIVLSGVAKLVTALQQLEDGVVCTSWRFESDFLVDLPLDSPPL